ncbi:hypothetical protein GY45DRAFT_181301 [Cubamyces sp. BRFM 1775]|nr:hypothetical protein GY45DRAFT_181301 [Cubamyces sp. BRFM 1775]
MSAAEQAAAIQDISSGLTDNRIQMATFALLTYEYFITFDREVNLFWKRKPTGATVLFLCTRYLALLSYNCLSALTYARWSDSYLVWAAFSSLRTLALSRMNWLLAVVVFILASGPFAVNVWLLSLGLTGANIPYIGCSGGSVQTAHQAVMSVSISRSSVIAADILVIAVTGWQTVKAGSLQLTLSWDATPRTLANVLLRNGMIYFLIVVTMNTLQLVLTVVSIVSPVNQISQVTILTDPMTAILTCRFLLALQSANQEALNPSLSTLQGDGVDDVNDTLRFASRVVDSVGGSLALVPEAVSEDDTDTEY